VLYKLYTGPLSNTIILDFSGSSEPQGLFGGWIRWGSIVQRPQYGGGARIGYGDGKGELS